MKKTSLPLILSLLLVFNLSLLPVKAQPPCNGNPAPNDYCESATVINNLDGYCGNTLYYTNNVSPTNNTNENLTPLRDVFCSNSISESSWLKFYATSTEAVFNIWTSNCFNNDGIEVQVFSTSDCNIYTPVSICWYSGTQTNGQISLINLIPGNAYLILIDGVYADVCDFEIAFVSGAILSPNCASNPVPPDNSTVYPSILSWTAAGGGVTGYKVYFGTDNPPQTLIQDSAITSCVPGALYYETQYFWKVVPYNISGDANDCPVWTFTPPCRNISGQITYLNTESTLLYDVEVQLRTPAGQLIQTTNTNYLGEYWFCEITPGDYQITVASSKVPGGNSATDALQALRHYVGQITLSGLKILAADVNASGYINTTDALLILRRFVGLVPTFPLGDWVFESGTFTLTNTSQIVMDLNGLCSGDLDGSFIPAPCSPLPTSAQAGPDQNTTSSNTYLEGNTPLLGSGSWTILSGTGGSVAQPDNPVSEFSGIAGNTYTLIWSISTICTSSTDTVVVTLTIPPFPCGTAFTDARDGRTYNTVQIGTQCWMRDNLNIGVMVTSTNIYNTAHSDCSDNGIIEKYCYWNDPANCDIYGGLYDWHEMMGYSYTQGIQGICPAGWHIPAHTEFQQLLNFLGGLMIAGGKMKETGYDHWSAPNAGATNESGFTGLGAGYRGYSGYFSNQLGYGVFWSSSATDAAYASCIYLDYLTTEVMGGGEGLSGIGMTTGHSVRCLKD